MFGHDPYAAKAMEYLLGIGFLFLFAAFWQYVVGGASALTARVPARARQKLTEIADMFRVPDGVMFHPGHAWARAEAGDVVAVGIDDFAQQLIGPIAKLVPPPVGAMVEQGASALTLAADSKSVDVLSPVTGRVVAVNQAALQSPRAVNNDPYGNGWLIKVRTPRLALDSRQLLTGVPARRWMDSSWEELGAMMTPELGTIMHDGGTPIAGFARGIDPTGWDAIARRFLLS